MGHHGIPGSASYTVGAVNGVRGRNSDNRLIEQKLGWKPTSTLREGLEKTYPWIEEQVVKAKNEKAATRI